MYTYVYIYIYIYIYRYKFLCIRPRAREGEDLARRNAPERPEDNTKKLSINMYVLIVSL